MRETDFDRDAAERVLRRAVALGSVDVTDPGRISARALFEAAEELGLDLSEVQRAIAEERLGLLGDEPHRSDRLVGPALVTASRVVPGHPEAVLELVDAWLRRARSLRRVRHLDGRAEYVRRKDPLAAAQRAVRTVGGEEQFARVQRLRVAVDDAGSGRSVVALVVDVHRSRTAAAAGGVAVTAGGVAGAGAGALAWAPWAWLGVPVAAAAGVGVMAARKGYVGGIDDELESLLDRLATGATPPSVLDGLADRFLRTAQRPSSSAAGPAAPPRDASRAAPAPGRSRRSPA